MKLEWIMATVTNSIVKCFVRNKIWVEKIVPQPYQMSRMGENMPDKYGVPNGTPHTVRRKPLFFPYKIPNGIMARYVTMLLIIGAILLPEGVKAIDYFIFLGPAKNKNLGSTQFGYTENDLTPCLITVKNFGNEPTGDLCVILQDKSAFMLKKEEHCITTIESIEVGRWTTFDVVPKTNLCVGRYEDTVIISNDFIYKSFKVSFTVNKAEQSININKNNPDYCLEKLTLSDNGDGDGEVTYKVSSKNNTGEVTQEGLVTFTGVGEINVKATKKETENYKSAEATCTIKVLATNENIDDEKCDNNTIIVRPPENYCKTNIVKKGDSILICNVPPKDVVSYHWGYINKEGGIIEYKTDSANYQYFKFQESIDTISNKYFVGIKYSNCCVPVRTYYEPENDGEDQIIFDGTSPPPKLSTYPNPAGQRFSLAMDRDIEGGFTVSLMNTSGQMVFREQYAVYRKEEELTIDFKMPAGIYLLAVETDEEVVTSKVIIE